MRPPALRNEVGIAHQHRPKFGATPGPTPAPLRAYYAPENRDSMLTQACQRGQQALPLLEVNRYRNKDPCGNFSRHPPRPKLPRRPNVKASILVRTFE